MPTTTEQIGAIGVNGAMVVLRLTTTTPSLLARDTRASVVLDVDIDVGAGDCPQRTSARRIEAPNLSPRELPEATVMLRQIADSIFATLTVLALVVPAPAPRVQEIAHADWPRLRVAACPGCRSLVMLHEAELPSAKPGEACVWHALCGACSMQFDVLVKSDAEAAAERNAKAEGSR